MPKVLTINQLDEINPKKRGGQKLVLVGGCFDILHQGHLRFLEKSKTFGDLLVVLLESDTNVRKLKGVNRPINNQLTRAKVLASLLTVDWVVMLPEMKDRDYDQLVLEVKPNVIATTQGDQSIKHKKRAATISGARLIFATPHIGNYSTTSLLKGR